MALEKVVVIDKIEVLEGGSIQVRQATKIIENGNELSSSFMRWALIPGDDLTGQDPKVVAIANAIWTAELIAAEKAKEAANLAKRLNPVGATPTLGA